MQVIRFAFDACAALRYHNSEEVPLSINMPDGRVLTDRRAVEDAVVAALTMLDPGQLKSILGNTNVRRLTPLWHVLCTNPPERMVAPLEEHAPGIYKTIAVQMVKESGLGPLIGE